MKNLVNCLFLIFLFISFNGKAIGQVDIWGQNGLLEQGVSLDIKVDYIDSFYALNAKLQLNKKHNFFIAKKIQFKDYFSRGTAILDDCHGTLFLSKMVMNREMIWAPNDYNILTQNLFDSNGKIVRNPIEMKELKPIDSVNISVKLNNIYPLELGYYVIYLRVKVKYKRKWVYIHSDPYSFQVDKLPPKKAKFHN